jgi:putative hemolysin
MFIFIGLFIVAALFIGSAFWSAAETGITSLSKFRIKKLIALNKALAAPLGAWLRSPYYLLTTIMIGNTVNDMALSFISTLVLVQAFAVLNREVVEFGSWLVMTALIIVLGELAPKIYGRAHSEKVTLFCLPILSRIETLTRPLLTPFVKIFRFMFPKADILPPFGRLASLSLEEVQGLIKEANHTGMLATDTSRMLEAVLRIGDQNVTRIMTPIADVDAVNLDIPEEDLLDLIVETGRSRVPVYRGDPGKMAGFVHTKDILWAWQKNQGHFSTELIRPPYVIRQEKKIYDLLREFQSGRTHMAFVADALGTVQGIITLEDILEEIVGEILDEYDLKKE